MKKAPVPHSQRLGYFFLFPNICFPLFPVIDYQTFKRTYFDRDHAQIYQKGIDWIFRGIIHLLLYRVVYHYFVPDPLAIRDLAGVGQYVLSSFLLYLRVSGLFHLIVGIAVPVRLQPAGNSSPLLPGGKLHRLLASHKHLLEGLHGEVVLLPHVHVASPLGHDARNDRRYAGYVFHYLAASLVSMVLAERVLSRCTRRT